MPRRKGRSLALNHARLRAAARRPLTSRQSKAVAKIAKKVALKTTEAKHVWYTEENIQLYHNMPHYTSNLFNTTLGVYDNDADNARRSIRIGDEIYCSNVNIRLWMSNKYDRPNCMYRVTLFLYPEDGTVNNSLVFFSQTNKMLDRLNTEKIKPLLTKYVKSSSNYADVEREHSKLISINHKFKTPRKLVFSEDTGRVKDWNLGMVVTCYDAYGTAQTDNIASFAKDIKVTFRDP
jgi:hypothetical protein